MAIRKEITMTIDQIMQSGADKIDNLVFEYNDNSERGKNIQAIKKIIEDTVNKVFCYRPDPPVIYEDWI